VPAGWLSDRFGARADLSLHRDMVGLHSADEFFPGFHHFAALRGLAVVWRRRAIIPASSGLMTRWAHIELARLCQLDLRGAVAYRRGGGSGLTAFVILDPATGAGLAGFMV
jgi:hypothetical protein